MQKTEDWCRSWDLKQLFLTPFHVDFEHHLKENKNLFCHLILYFCYLSDSFWPNLTFKTAFMRLMVTEGIGSEKEVAPHSSTLASLPWMEEPGRLQSMRSQSLTWQRDFTFTFHFHALEKEMVTHSGVLAWRIPGKGGAWWAAVCEVPQSQTWLKWLSNVQG